MCSVAGLIRAAQTIAPGHLLCGGSRSEYRSRVGGRGLPRAWSFRDLIQRSLRRLPGHSRATGTIAARLGLTCSLDVQTVAAAFREVGTASPWRSLLQARERSSGLKAFPRKLDLHFLSVACVSQGPDPTPRFGADPSGRPAVAAHSRSGARGGALGVFGNIEPFDQRLHGGRRGSDSERIPARQQERRARSLTSCTCRTGQERGHRGSTRVGRPRPFPAGSTPRTCRSCRRGRSHVLIDLSFNRAHRRPVINIPRPRSSGCNSRPAWGSQDPRRRRSICLPTCAATFIQRSSSMARSEARWNSRLCSRHTSRATSSAGFTGSIGAARCSSGKRVMPNTFLSKGWFARKSRRNRRKFRAGRPARGKSPAWGAPPKRDPPILFLLLTTPAQRR